MIKKNKILFTLLMILALAALVIPMASCKGNGNGGNKISEIYIEKSDLPRTEYVEGQNLDLEKGKLTVVTDGKESKVPLTAPEVTVSGYDKDTLGGQTITVQYAGLSTSFNVTVSPRTVAEKFETKYFIGDEFKADMGRIKIMTDDAKSFYVNMNDEKVSVVSFDSSKAGTSAVTLLYNDGSNSYYCQFDVTVYEMSNIEFVAPIKTEYLSHEEGPLNILGGYFKVTAADGTLTKSVTITESMVKDSGFDLSVATIENRKTPYEQTITVKYLDKTATYTIYITFSGVSAINYYANGDLSKIDWKKATEEGLTEKESEAALAAINEYYELSDTNRALLSDEVKSLIGRAGTLAVAKLFYTELETYNKTFKLNTSGGISFGKSTYEQTKTDIERFNNLDADINVYASLLRKIAEEFADEILVDEVAVKKFVLIYSAEAENLLREVLNHLVSVFELIKDIPENWTVDTLKDPTIGENILSATMQIYNAEYYKKGNRAYYTNMLNTWREKNDVFDILYTYFLYNYEGGEDFMRNYMIGNMPLPGRLNDWYTGLLNAVSMSKWFASNGNSSAFLYDVSEYMHNYFKTLEIAEEIKTSDNNFLKDIYRICNGDYMNRANMYTYSVGYLYHINAMIDSEAFHNLWQKYYVLLKVYYEEGQDKISSTTHKQEILDMVAAFEELSPSELLGFLSSMNLLYTSGKGKYPMLGHTKKAESDEKGVVYNVFSLILSNHYATYLTDTNKDIFNNVLSAMETFVLIGYKDGALEEFNTKMAALEDAISKLSAEDAENFNQYCKKSYDKYFSIYEITSGKKTAELNAEETELINELHDILTKYIIVYSTIYSYSQAGQNAPADMFPILYALYARAESVRNSILATGSKNAVLSMYAIEKDFVLTEETVIKYTIERAFFLADSVTTSVLTSNSATFTDENGIHYLTYWDLYEDEGFAKFLSDASDVMFSSYFKGGKPLDHETLTKFMKQMREFNLYDTSVIVLLNVDDTIYRALSVYYSSVLSNDGIGVNQDLIIAEMAYKQYFLTNKTNAEYRQVFITSMENLKADYEALSAEEKAYLSDMYNYYAELLEEAKKEAAADENKENAA